MNTKLFFLFSFFLPDLLFDLNKMSNVMQNVNAIATTGTEANYSCEMWLSKHSQKMSDNRI